MFLSLIHIFVMASDPDADRVGMACKDDKLSLIHISQERVEAVLAQGRYLHQVFAVEVGV